ncbi:hypothetical protein LQV63_11915 [Paenibacillus profundus]|uniref:Uncharacterized protein n=1 Tax=Paenibacillus profundus TaxID=1173085 RepID=A0ABS8YI50_9BACL|nr:hypothetical protein [Paenibacillus profundus]MCE5170016.1 hypothetical protein [Paenibacillus profundus]
MSLFKIVMQELPFHPELHAQLQKVIVSQIKERVEAVIRKFQAEGKLVNLPMGTTIRLTASIIVGYILTRATFGIRDDSGWDDELEREATITFVMKALSP